MDTPGVGDSRELKTMLEEYIPKAVAFVIIMDVTRAGGLQKDRVKKMLSSKDWSKIKTTKCILMCVVKGVYVA